MSAASLRVPGPLQGAVHPYLVFATVPEFWLNLGRGERKCMMRYASPTDLALMAAMEDPIDSLAEETAHLKRAALAAEAILYRLSLLREDEFAVLERHGLTRGHLTEVANSGLLARHRVTRAESEGVA
ncbi:hypothetical protein RJ40_02405 [Methanofollis aquaemaris]|uniref:Uncharacterized protein n=1 Tax=Methanofollis aquaemaris TaxID=126734 RepID=A0A8A3S3H2_9EURY|nr:hypothetical protein [Methanofollis aquaemaris]QSZ66429.1 hypothetical protein RJ40_02405 [Methanofollis aquaemaris]